MNKMIKIFIPIVLVLSLVLSALSQPKADDDVIFRAVEDEMARSLKDLKLKDFNKPYFVEYIVEDVDMLTITATFGAIKTSNLDKSRILFTEVRIGDYGLDSSGSYSFKLPYPMPLDDDYTSLRRTVWFVTDRSYKQAIDSYESIKADNENSTDDEEDKVPSLSKEKPIVSIESRGNLEVDKQMWEKRVREWSAEFRKYPEFRESNFNFYVRQANRYLVNSEGTKILKPEFLVTFDIHARSATEDNTLVEPYRHIFATNMEEVPTVEELNKEIQGLSADLKKFKNAQPFKDTYIGPAMFTEGASVQLFLQLLAPNLSGGEYADRLGRKVLPSFLSVVDDPTITKVGDSKVYGNYKYDAEGVEAKPLNLIDNGILKTLLMTRRPIKEIPNSNGRARGSGLGGTSANISNLIIKSNSGKSYTELKQQLIDECKKQGLEFGIIFRENDSTFSSFSGGGSILAYKVYVKDGREELFRDISVMDLTVRELRNLLAAGNDSYTYNLLVNSSYNGDGTPASVTAPTILLDEVYLKKSKFNREKPRLITNPFFDKK